LKNRLFQIICRTEVKLERHYPHCGRLGGQIHQERKILWLDQVLS
jgi:hypothetical protein